MQHVGRIIGVLAGLFIAGAGLPVSAQEFPLKPIRMVITVVGGVPDVVSRFLGPIMSTSLGQPIVVEARPGGGGILAIQETINSKPDGYTLLCGSSGEWAVLPALRPGSYDPRDLAPLGNVLTSILFLVADGKLGVKTPQEFLALVKSKPGAFSYGSSGNGSIHHLFMEVFKSNYGLDIVHVPFSKGSSEAVASMLGGNIQMLIASHGLIAQYVKTGQMVPIVTATQRRSPFLPEVPSLADLKLKDNFSGDMGYFVRTGTPKAVVDKLAAALGRAVKSPEYVEKMKSFGVEAVYMGPEEFGELVRTDLANYARAAKIANVKID